MLERRDLETKRRDAAATPTATKLKWLVAGAALAALGRVGYEGARYLASGHAALAPTAVAQNLPLEEYEIDPTWILEGKPIFRARAFGPSSDLDTVAGIWECIGPAKFRWHFQADETVYVLEGGVNVEYEGKVHHFVPGSASFFPAGSTAIWHVPERVKKSYVLTSPGRLQRALRRVAFSYP